MAAIGKLTRALSAQTRALNQLAQSNAALAEAAFTLIEAGEEPGNDGLDMAGNPIRPS